MRLLPRTKRGTWLLAATMGLGSNAAVWFLPPPAPRAVLRLPEPGRPVGFLPAATCS